MVIVYILTHLAHFKVFGSVIQYVQFYASALLLCQQHNPYNPYNHSERSTEVSRFNLY